MSSGEVVDEDDAALPTNYSLPARIEGPKREGCVTRRGRAGGLVSGARAGTEIYQRASQVGWRSLISGSAAASRPAGWGWRRNQPAPRGGRYIGVGSVIRRPAGPGFLPTRCALPADRLNCRTAPPSVMSPCARQFLECCCRSPPPWVGRGPRVGSGRAIPFR